MQLAEEVGVRQAEGWRRRTGGLRAHGLLASSCCQPRPVFSVCFLARAEATSSTIQAFVVAEALQWDLLLLVLLAFYVSLSRART